MNIQPLHFSIGAINVALQSDLRSFLDEFLTLYAPYRTDHAGDKTIEIQVKTSRRMPWRRGTFTIHGDQGEGFTVERRYEVLPHIEWMINWQIIRQQNSFLQLHAATLEHDGHAIVLPGAPGSGKSTLTAGLLAKGWSYLCDEFALINPKSLRLHPFPRALCMKAPSFPVVKELRLPLQLKTPYHKPTKGRVAFLDPLHIRPDITGRPSRVRWVVFPKYTPGETPTLHPMSRAEGAYELARQCFNLRVHEARAIHTLAGIARNADCYRLISGEIHETCELIRNMTANTTLPRARCA